MAKLIESIALSGSRKSDGTANASGKAYGYVIGTSTEATLYADASGDTVLAQPVTLDAAGKATIYIDQAVTLHVETAAGVSVGEIDVEDSPGPIAVRNAAFTGTLSDGSQGAGGVTDLDTVLTSALSSFGGTDFNYSESSGSTSRPVGEWMREDHVSVIDFGAFGDNSHDDTAAIQAAVNRAVAVGGGTVLLPLGTYLISAPITKASGASITIRGVGLGTVLKNTATTTEVLTLAAAGVGTEFVEVSSLLISHSSGSTAAAIEATGYGTLSVRNCRITGHQTGVLVTSVGNPWSADLYGTDITTTTNAASKAIAVSGGASRLTIVNGRYSAPTGTCVDLPSATYTTVLIFANTFSTAATGISTGTTGFAVISVVGNTFATITTVISVTGSSHPIRQWSNYGIDGYSVGVLTGGTVVPNLCLGTEILITGTTTGSAYVISPPAPLPDSTTRDYKIIIRFKNAAGGAVTGWTLDAIYHLENTVPLSLADGFQTAVIFLWDGTVFRAISQVVTAT